MKHSYWLFKTEPETYRFAQLQKDKRTNWNGVRNFQARNYLKQVEVGDQVLIYHSGKDKAVVGVAEVIKSGYTDPDPETPGEWVQVDIAPVEALPRPVTLAEMKAKKELAGILLIKQSRLSVMPVVEKHFQLIKKMALLSILLLSSDLFAGQCTSKVSVESAVVTLPNASPDEGLAGNDLPMPPAKADAKIMIRIIRKVFRIQMQFRDLFELSLRDCPTANFAVDLRSTKNFVSSDKIQTGPRDCLNYLHDSATRAFNLSEGSVAAESMSESRTYT